ncbi:hypothetical protein [Chitinimonas lacunae]|uniref:Uncharacterized protein n=1 Tax=Chitinimonas lacunae TaxID=1963018 RepID=A0ABV8MUB1_9NEIS
MSIRYTIQVRNLSPNKQEFFFFQKPAQYLGGGPIYSNSIYQEKLRPNKEGATLIFEFEQQFYAGVEQRSQAVIKPGQASGHTIAVQPIDLTLASGDPTNNATNMLLPDLGLSVPQYSDVVEPGSFRVTTAAFDSTVSYYNVGLAVQHPKTRASVLSSFTDAGPSLNIDCQPIMVFYVQTGSHEPGQVINYTKASVNAAVCDATKGVTFFNVDYLSDGTWRVEPVM